MQKAISKYGLAAHLAILAVAPLFLYPFCSPAWTAKVLLWLSFMAAVWMLNEPSRRNGEMLHDARRRVFFSICKDPLFWVMLVLLAIAAARSLNGGVEMAYNAEESMWSLKPPFIPYFPGCVDGAGTLPFATAMALVVVVQACKYAMGKSARVVFLFISSFLGGVAAIAAIALCACGHEGLLEIAKCSEVDASYMGHAFGLLLSAGLVALVGSFERQWKRAMPLLLPAIGGCGAGLYCFSTDIVIIVHAVAAVVVLAASLVYAHRKVGGLVIPRCLALILISAAAGFLLVYAVVPESVRADRFAWLQQEEVGHLFSERFIAARERLSSIALNVWKDRPWLGTGIGSFGYEIRFKAEESDWTMLDSSQSGALNGWWQLLAERGISGLVFLAVPIMFLLWAYARRAAQAFMHAVSRRHFAEIALFHPICWLGPISVVVTVACGFIDHSFWRPETMMTVAAMFAMSGSAFPAVDKSTDAESDSEK